MYTPAIAGAIINSCVVLHNSRPTGYHHENHDEKNFNGGEAEKSENIELTKKKTPQDFASKGSYLLDIFLINK